MPVDPKVQRTREQLERIVQDRNRWGEPAPGGGTLYTAAERTAAAAELLRSFGEEDRLALEQEKLNALREKSVFDRSLQIEDAKTRRIEAVAKLIEAVEDVDELREMVSGQIKQLVSIETDGPLLEDKSL